MLHLEEHPVGENIGGQESDWKNGTVLDRKLCTADNRPDYVKISAKHTIYEIIYSCYPQFWVFARFQKTHKVCFQHVNAVIKAF